MGRFYPQGFLEILTSGVEDLSSREELIMQGNEHYIQKKLNGLCGGTDGYTEDLEAAREFNESLVEKRDPRAIKRKIKALTEGKKGYQTSAGEEKGYGYKNDLKAAREFNEFFVEKGDPEALESLCDRACRREVGKTSFGSTTIFDNTLHKPFNELFVEKGNPIAIVKKIKGLKSGEMGYEKNPLLAREFIESLVVDKNSVARGIGKYIKAFAMKYGISQLGYEKNREKAIDFIKENHVPY